MKREVVVVLGVLPACLLEELGQRVRAFACKVVDLFEDVEAFRHEEAARQCVVSIELFSLPSKDVTGDKSANGANDDDLVNIFGGGYSLALMVEPSVDGTTARGPMSKRFAVG